MPRKKTPRHSSHINIHQDIWDAAQKSIEGTRKTFTERTNELWELELKKTGFLSKHN